MKFLPVSLNISRKKILLVGGGAVALQKLRVLAQFTRRVEVVGLSVSLAIRTSGFRWKEKAYESADLTGFSIVYACTDRRALNRRIVSDAHERGMLANVVDDPALCDFISPAIWKKGKMTVAVSSDGTDAKRSVALRDRIKERVGP
jgi:precorrin-2 dehydrogenase/sirohydrochlorin ferrochelatase